MKNETSTSRETYKKIVSAVLIVGVLIFAFIKYAPASASDIAWLVGFLVPPAVIGLAFSRVDTKTSTGVLVGAIVFSLITIGMILAQ